MTSFLLQLCRAVFIGCHCSGELVLKSKRDVDWQKIIKQSSLHFSPGYAGYCLSYSKSLYVHETLFMARAEPYSSMKTVLTPLVHGSMPNSSPSLTEPFCKSWRSYFLCSFRSLRIGYHGTRSLVFQSMEDLHL
jgi:hypothetical protein